MRQLFDNAIKYSPAGSTIGVGAAHVDGGVEISVANSGSWIPEHEQSRVLERFYRGERARLVPGTGMGLAIVRQIVEAHGGALTLASSTASGTVFTLSFPDAREVA
jgi:two-component system sensor histidine kinase SenX3